MSLLRRHDTADRTPEQVRALAEADALLRRAGLDPATALGGGPPPAPASDQDGRTPPAERSADGEAGVAPRSPQQAEAIARRLPGGTASTPTEVPARGWLQIAKRGLEESGKDQVPLLAAGVAFYAFLSVFPALIAVVLVYGLVADPATVQAQVNSVSGSLPESAARLLQDQLTALVSTSSTGLGWGLVVSVAVALWSASNGVGNLMKAVNTAYDEEETRGFVKIRGLALALTAGAIVFVVVAIALIAALPVVLDALSLPTALEVLVQVVRWLVLLGAFAVALAVVYRVAPDRDAPKLRWVSVGAVVATVVWVLVSVGFTLYANLGGYGSSYGSLAGVVVLLFWLWLTAYAVLLGAEVNAEAEQQTVRDTTTGPDAPIGSRDAYKADTLAEPAR